MGPWDGPIVNFIASATELDIPGHETSRDEIVAFGDKSVKFVQTALVQGKLAGRTASSTLMISTKTT